jgi:hypothetical protein
MTPLEVVGLISNLTSIMGLTIVGTIKYIKANENKRKAVLGNPLFRAFGFVSGGTIICSLIIFGWGKVHFGEIKPQIVHDTINKVVYKRDTIYRNAKPEKKVFNNKINSVNTLDQH